MSTFDGMQGTYVKRDAAGLYFMSKKGIWKPMRFPAHIDIASLIPGNKYGIELQGRELVNLVDLGPNKFFEQNLAEHGGGAPIQQGAAPAPQPQAPTAPAAQVRPDGLMASATGVVKSLLENNEDMSADQAFRYGLQWAGMWGELPARAEHFLNGADNAQKMAAAKAAIQQAAGLDPNDEVPF